MKKFIILSTKNHFWLKKYRKRHHDHNMHSMHMRFNLTLARGRKHQELLDLPLKADITQATSTNAKDIFNAISTVCINAGFCSCVN